MQSNNICSHFLSLTAPEDDSGAWTCLISSRSATLLPMKASLRESLPPSSSASSVSFPPSSSFLTTPSATFIHPLLHHSSSSLAPPLRVQSRAPPINTHRSFMRTDPPLLSRNKTPAEEEVRQRKRGRYCLCWRISYVHLLNSGEVFLVISFAK